MFRRLTVSDIIGHYPEDIDIHASRDDVTGLITVSINDQVCTYSATEAKFLLLALSKMIGKKESKQIINARTNKVRNEDASQ